MSAVVMKVWQGLVRLARRIGRWLIRKLADTALIKLIGYMEGKIADFKRRKVPPKGRIKRWTLAVKWLTQHSKQLRNKTVQLYCREVDTRLADVPEVSPFEAEAA